MGLTVGNVAAKPNNISKGALRVGCLADGAPINLPVFIACGRKDGPTVWVEACIHGDEYGGAAAIIEYMQALDVGALQGTIIAVPVANPPSFNFRSRVSSIDGQNLNRIFPGSPGGSHSFQLASVISEHIAEKADFLLDLHSGGISDEVPFYSVFNDDGTEMTEKSKHLAKRVGVKTVWRMAGTPGMDGTVFAVAQRHGVPSIVVETGGGTSVDEPVRNYLTAIRGFMQATGVAPGEPMVQDSYAIISGGSFIHNREGGLFVPECAIGDILPKDALIGRIIDLHGSTVEEIRNPLEDAYMAAVRCRYFPTHAGEICAEAVPVEAHEKS